MSSRSPRARSSAAPGPRPFTSSVSHGPLVTNVRPTRIASLNAATDSAWLPSCAYTRAQPGGLEITPKCENERKVSVPAVAARRNPHDNRRW